MHEKFPDIHRALRPFFKGVFMGNGSQTPETAAKAIQDGEFDIISFGKLYICNPDLALRIQKNQELDTVFDYKTYYRGEAKGYTDYPVFDEWKKEKKEN